MIILQLSRNNTVICMDSTVNLLTLHTISVGLNGNFFTRSVDIPPQALVCRIHQDTFPVIFALPICPVRISNTLCNIIDDTVGAVTEQFTVCVTDSNSAQNV